MNGGIFMKYQITFSTYWIDYEKVNQARREKAFKARACKPATRTKPGFGKVNVNRKG